jgi:hypothetical protein
VRKPFLQKFRIYAFRKRELNQRTFRCLSNAQGCVENVAVGVLHGSFAVEFSKPEATKLRRTTSRPTPTRRRGMHSAGMSSVAVSSLGNRFPERLLQRLRVEALNVVSLCL